VTLNNLPVLKSSKLLQIMKKKARRIGCSPFLKKLVNKTAGIPSISFGGKIISQLKFSAILL